jgi:hypothetical protein
VTNELVIAIVGVSGTVIVSLGAGASQLANSARQRKWAKEDAVKARTEATEDSEENRKEERRLRLFDHRRTAYTNFYAEYLRYYDALYPHVYDLDSGPEPDYDAFDPLLSKLSRVKMYGSKEAASTGKALSTAFIKWAQSVAGTRDHLYKAVESAEEAFLAACRLDLGVEE